MHSSVAARLYGSRARGQRPLKEDSDVDVHSAAATVPFLAAIDDLLAD
jgi:hypothetical protein